MQIDIDIQIIVLLFIENSLSSREKLLLDRHFFREV